MKQVKLLEQLIRIYPTAIPANPTYGTIQPELNDTIQVLKTKQLEVLNNVS